MRVLVVDAERPARERLTRLLERLPVVEAVTACRDGQSAVALLTSEGYDLILLDIQMRGLDGGGIIAQLRSGNAPPVVFLTAYDESTVRAFEANAIDYLLKPVDEDRLREAVERARTPARLDRSASARPAAPAGAALARRHSEWLLVKEPGEVRIIPMDEVDLFEAAGNYVYVHRERERLLHRESLASLESRLDPTRFVRIHRSAIVNVGSVKSLEPIAAGDYRVHLHSGRETRLSRTYRQSFIDRVGGPATF